jgi:hypothetical protein
MRFGLEEFSPLLRTPPACGSVYPKVKNPQYPPACKVGNTSESSQRIAHADAQGKCQPVSHLRESSGVCRISNG